MDFLNKISSNKLDSSNILDIILELIMTYLNLVD